MSKTRVTILCGTTYLTIYLRMSAMLVTLPAFLSLTVGPATRTDGRPYSPARENVVENYAATFIDQGYCFNASEWTFPDCPLRGVYANNCVYEGVTGWEAFEPALSRAEEMDADAIWRCAAGIPEEWYEGDRDGLNRLVEALHHRRGAIRRLITEFRKANRNPFPNWRDSPICVDLAVVQWSEGLHIR
jgi:hypothetical protein